MLILGFRKQSCCVPVICLAVLAVAFAGCGQKVEMRQVDMFQGTDKADKEKAQEYIEKAGIKGEVVGLQDEGPSWVVDVGPPRSTEGGRQMPAPPNSYRVDKATGKILAGGSGPG